MMLNKYSYLYVSPFNIKYLNAFHVLDFEWRIFTSTRVVKDFGTPLPLLKSGFLNRGHKFTKLTTGTYI